MLTHVFIFQTKYEEDEDFVEGIEDEELEDKEHVVGKILSHLSDEKYFLMGDLAAEYAVPEHDEEHSDSSDLDEMKDVEESEVSCWLITCLYVHHTVAVILKALRGLIHYCECSYDRFTI